MPELRRHDAPLVAARRAYAAGDWPAALAEARVAVERLPGSTAALLLAVDAAQRAGALALAVPWLEALLRRHPAHPPFLGLLSEARAALDPATATPRPDAGVVAP